VNEAGFIKKVHRKLPKEIYRCKFADRFTSGLPDCWYSGPRADLWVEYKYSEHPHRKPGLTEHQKRWLTERAKEGRNVAVMVGSPDNSNIVIHHKGDFYQPANFMHCSFDECINWIKAEVS
jgi:hypothetical protein